MLPGHFFPSIFKFSRLKATAATWTQTWRQEDKEENLRDHEVSKPEYAAILNGKGDSVSLKKM